MSGLRLRTLKEILGNMMSYVTANSTKITDLNPGSVSRTLLEAVSLQIEELYYSMFKNFLWAVENAVFNAFSFTRKTGIKSSGNVTVEFVNALEFSLTIPKNTEFITRIGNRYYFVSKQSVTAPIGSTSVQIPVECAYVGEAGNISAGDITAISTPYSAINRVYNSEDFTNGKDPESLEERRQRFSLYIDSLSKGTDDAIIYGALQVDGITGASVDPDSRGITRVYVHGNTGATISQELVAAVVAKLEDYRAGGIEIRVYPVVEKQVSINVNVVINEGYDEQVYLDLLNTATINYFKSFVVSKNFYVSELITFYKNLSPSAILSIKVNAPTGDIIVKGEELVVLGTKAILIETYYGR